ncbi:MAG: 50S ribosomal protein L15 [Dehalococcoidia bacterium]|nr:50S ribosomal protein L15 [Dehalococcoidia bacterium]
MKLNDLRPPVGARHKARRVGRGDGSGRGTYSGRGCKGQKSRSGGGVRLGFEGGQLPLIKRLPRKRGFTNIFRIEYNVVNVGKLNIFPEGSEVNASELLEAGLIKSLSRPTKILGGGEVDRSLSVKVDKVSASAKRKIIGVGGRVEQA